jgi:hypothetical protein
MGSTGSENAQSEYMFILHPSTLHCWCLLKYSTFGRDCTSNTSAMEVTSNRQTYRPSHTKRNRHHTLWNWVCRVHSARGPPSAREAFLGHWGEWYSLVTILPTCIFEMCEFCRRQTGWSWKDLAGKHGVWKLQLLIVPLDVIVVIIQCQQCCIICLQYNDTISCAHLNF